MGITSEQRPEGPEGSLGRAGCARYSALRVPFAKRNKSGTAEVIRAFVS